MENQVKIIKICIYFQPKDDIFHFTLWFERILSSVPFVRSKSIEKSTFIPSELKWLAAKKYVCLFECMYVITIKLTNRLSSVL